MAFQFIDTRPGIRIVTVPILYSAWAATNTSVSTAVRIPKNAHVVDAKLFKEIAFDVGEIAIGHGAVASERESLGSLAECNATTAGTVELTAWRTGTYSTIVGGFNGLLAANFRDIFLRYNGASLPAAGRATLILSLYDMSPRATL